MKQRIEVLQQGCVDLRRLSGGKYRVELEESAVAERSPRARRPDPWLLVIPGRRGQVYPMGGGRLAAKTNCPGKTARRLLAVPGAVLYTDGSDGVTVVFDASVLPKVARTLGLRTKRRLSDSQRKAAVARLAQARLKRTRGQDAPPGDDPSTSELPQAR